MLAIGLVFYGFLMSFIIASSARNRREGRRNPMILTATGYVMLGLTVGAAAMLPIWALVDPASATALVDMG